MNERIAGSLAAFRAHETRKVKAAERDGRLYVPASDDELLRRAEAKVGGHYVAEEAVESGAGYLYALRLPKGYPDLLKIGKTKDVTRRVAELRRDAATAMPEAFEIACWWRVEDEGTIEDLVHAILKIQKKHVGEAPGTEWFRTTVTEINGLLLSNGVEVREIASEDDADQADEAARIDVVRDIAAE